MHIVQFLPRELQRDQFHRMAVLLPYLVVGVVRVVLARIAEGTKQPLPPAFWYGFDGLDNFLGGMLFEITDDARQWFTSLPT